MSTNSNKIKTLLIFNILIPFLQCFLTTHTFYLVLLNYELNICLLYC